MEASSRYTTEPRAVVLVRLAMRRGDAVEAAAAELVASGEFADYLAAWSWARREYLYASVRRATWARRD